MQESLIPENIVGDIAPDPLSKFLVLGSGISLTRTQAGAPIKPKGWGFRKIAKRGAQQAQGLETEEFQEHVETLVNSLPSIPGN